MKKLLLLSSEIIGFCIISILVLLIWLPIGQSMRIAFGFVYVLVLPGLLWSCIFWKKDSLSVLERGVLSLSLSIAMAPLLTFICTKFGLRITARNVFFEIAAIILSALIIIIVQSRIRRRAMNKNLIASK